MIILKFNPEENINLKYHYIFPRFINNFSSFIGIFEIMQLHNDMRQWKILNWNVYNDINVKYL